MSRVVGKLRKKYKQRVRADRSAQRSMSNLTLLTNDDKTSLLSNIDDQDDDSDDDGDTTAFDVGSYLNVNVRNKHAGSKKKKYFDSNEDHRDSELQQDNNTNHCPLQCDSRHRIDSWDSNASLDNVQTRVRTLTEFDIKRCSLFTDQGYVKMYTLERAGIQVKRFSSKYNSFYSTFSTDSEDEFDIDSSGGGYLRMTPPYLNINDKQSTVITEDSHSHQYNLENNPTKDNEKNKESQAVHSKSRTIDSRLTKSNLDVSHSNSLKSTTWSSRKPISLYERLMHEVTDRLPEETAMNYSETELVDELDFNPIESRIIYHTARGWKPNISFSMQSWQDKFPEDFSVNELYLYITRQGNSRLAEYLRKYHVDGYFMFELVKDDMLLDERLFDDNFLTPNELKKLRSHFYPERPRCNALKEKFVLAL